MTSVSVKNLSFSYGNNPCLSDISLDIEKGDFIALVGPNGAGKSTLLKCIAGNYRSYEGEINFFSKSIKDYSILELSRIRSVMEQNTEVSFEYLVHDVILMGRSCIENKLPLQEEEKFIEECLEKADIQELRYRKISALSGGEKARVALARVLAQDCPVVLLDEPTASLDIKHQESTMRIAKNLTEKGYAVVVVLHDLNLAAAYCNKVVLLQEGKLVSSGSFEEVFTSEVLSSVYQHPIEVVYDKKTMRIEPVRFFTE